MQDRITIDFETRSEADIMNVGAYAYAIHPSTEVLMIAYKIPGREAVLWTRTEDEPPYELFEAIQDEFDNYFIEAHNSFFELMIWQNVCVKKMGWPPLPLDRLRCSAAKAAAHTMPRALEDAALAMRLVQKKDKRGKRLIKLLCQPQKPTKADPRVWINEDQTEPVKFAKDEFYTPAELFEMLGEYCLQDVETEEELSANLDDLPPDERKIWLMDQGINLRGFYCDIPLAKNANQVLEVLQGDINNEIQELTDGFVDSPTKRDAILLYCDLAGYKLDGLTKDHVEKALQREDWPKDVGRLLKLRQLGGGTATKKFTKFIEMADDEQIIKGTLMYHGASTGRWTGKGVQTQNLPRGIFTNIEEITECIDLVNNHDLKGLRDKYENPIEAIASCIRSVITARPGYELFVADYSAIEARVLVWIAGDKNALSIFHRGEDIYLDMAYDIFSITAEQYQELDDYNKWYYRFVGKQAILGLGYQMGHPRFKKEALKQASMDLDLEFCEEVVSTYREKYHKVKKLWDECNNAAIKAVAEKRGRKRAVKVGKIKYYRKKNFLCCELPSGRCLHFHRPRVEEYEWNGMPKKKLTYWGVDPYTKKYGKLDTYGGSLVESICQGTARDIMSYAALEVEKAGYRILTSVHDELVSERKAGEGCVEEYEQLLCTLPAWADGCPIDAEGWTGRRYKK
jgi:DNA polymerase bacteriophage-type